MEREPPQSELVAALDLGSNSFHMIVGRLGGGRLEVMDRMRERVQLGAGLDDDRRLSEEAQRRALRCLSRFGERVRTLPPDHVRAVGTNTLRQARNAERFLERAHIALGHPIEIIAGREEARLIYLGVLQTMPSQAFHRLVVDIGGGSTECIVGERAEILEADSLYMGCVSFSLRFFPRGQLTEGAFQAAELAAQLELQPIARRYRALGWDLAVGCSGTIHAIDRILNATGWSDEGITAKALKKLEKALLAAGSVARLSLPGLQEDRKPVIAGGVAILRAIFDTLRVERMVPSPGALREGALYDLVGRIRHEDVRDRTIRWYCQRWSVDMEQVGRVERTARELMSPAAAGWALDPELGERLLSWAAHLHELGLAISHTAYQKHSAYLVEHGDMAGFSRTDQRSVAAMIQGHRRKLKPEYFQGIPQSERQQVLLLTILFRLAVCLHRSRSDEPLPLLRVAAKRGRLRLTFPRGWLDEHPLTAADLTEQAQEIRRAGVVLVVSETRPRAPERPRQAGAKKRRAKAGRKRGGRVRRRRFARSSSMRFAR